MSATEAGARATLSGPDCEDPYELSPTQEAMLLHTIWEPGSAVYFHQVVLTLDDPDLPAFLAAWRRVLARHPILRTSFHWEGLESPVQVVHRDVELPVDRIDWRGLSRRQQEDRLRAFLRADRERGCVLTEAPLLRLTLVRLDETTYHCVKSNHHLLLDAWSGATVLKEVQALYRALRRGRRLELPEPRSYRDFIAWLRGQDLAAAEAFWRDQLAGFTSPTPLPGDRAAGAAGEGARFVSHRLTFPATLSAGLHSLAHRTRVTTGTAIQGAWALLLSLWSGERDVVFGATVSGRPAELDGVEAMVGLFINALPVRAGVPPDAPVEEWLRELHAEHGRLQRFQHSPPAQVQAWSEIPRGVALYETLVTFNSQAMGSGPAVRAGPASERGGAHEVARLDATSQPLSLIVVEGVEELHLDLTADARRFEAGTLIRLLEQLRTLLEGIVANPERPVGELSLTTPAEWHRVVIEPNRTETSFPRQRCLHELFEATAGRVPDATAVSFEGHGLTYAELNRRSNRLAHHLRALGVGPDVLVGLSVEPSVDLAVGLLAVLKAGGGYVPLDPGYPPARLAFMVEDSRAAVLLTQERLAGAWSDLTVPLICIDRDAGDWADRGVEDPSTGVEPEHVAFVIYTSGSTGTPKGVAVPHRVCVNRMHIESDPLRAGEVLCVKTSLNFIDSVWELFSAWTHGLRTVLAPADRLIDPARLVPLLAGERVTRLVFVPSLLRMLLDSTDPLAEQLPDLLHWISSGEPLPRDLSERFAQRLPGRVLTNLYGTSETWDATRCDTREHPPQQKLPIGRPMGNCRVYVLDARLRPVPVGVPGELYVGGAGLARGYHRRPELTAERFVPDPFSGEPGARMYRTGDRARWLPGGQLESVGRVDQQLKVRGFRVEPGEIEAVLRRHDAVRQAVVSATAQQQLIAHLELAAGEKLAEAELRAFARRQLPDHMVPSRWIAVERIPLTPSGKVDRRALRTKPAAQPVRVRSFVAPRTAEEETIAGVWADVLGLEQVGVEDDFFELGGHSLLATQVIARIRAALEVGVPIQALFEGPTVAALADWVAAHRGAETDAAPPLIAAPAGPDGRREAPQSFAQQRLWFAAQLAPGSPLYNVVALVPLTGALDLEALERAVGELVRRHESLRTTFGTGDGEPVQRIAAPEPVAVAVVDVRDQPPDTRQAALQRVARRHVTHRYDLSRGPLARFTLVRLEDARQMLVVGMHHVVTDGWSMAVVRRELRELYAAFRAREPSHLPELPVQYADFAIWQRQWLRGQVLEAQLDYWRRRLARAAYLELPTDHRRPATPRYATARLAFEIERSVVDRLREVGRAADATLFMVLLAAFQVLVGRYSAQDDVVIGSPIANRTRAELEGVVGFLVNTLVLRTDLSGDPSFRELLSRVRETCLGAYAHQDLPFEKLVEELAPQRDPGVQPLVGVLFILQNTPGDPGPAAPRDARSQVGAAQPAEFSSYDLTLWSAEVPTGVSAALQFNTTLFDTATAQRIVGHFQTLVSALAERPERPLSSISMLLEGEHRQVVDDPNGTRAPYARDRCLHERFEEQAALTPKAVAVIAGDERLTYRELDQRANRLAHQLLRRDVRPGTLVAVCVERSVAAVTAVLAILKAGAAFLALDPAHSADRLTFMLRDSRAALLLTEEALLSRLATPEREAICLDRDRAAWAGESPDGPGVATDPRQPAYVTYTSGSTGVPKGVVGLHRGTVNCLEWLAAAHPPAHDEIAQAKTAVSVARSVWELFWPLLSGGCVVATGEARLADPRRLVEHLRAEEVTRIVLAPAVLSALLDVEPDLGRLDRLRLWIVSGETLTVELAQRFRRSVPAAALVNLYGQAEVSAIASAYDTRLLRGDAASVPIGRPIANSRLYVLDRHLQPLPAGVPGELYAGGDGLARGYLERPELTAERFLPDPFSAEPGARLYRTGDRARRLPDGQLQLLGRAELEIRVGAFRVEPGDVEAVLCRHPGVRQAVVVAAGEHRIGAYVVAAGGAAPPASELRELARRYLPAYMVPALVMALERLPLTPTGRLDRRALPALGAAESGSRHVQPRSFTEQVVADVWAEVLRRDRVGAHENFFELGGHSLLATQVLSRLRFAVGVEVPIPVFFEMPTVAALARWVEAHRGSGEADRVPALVAGTPSPDGRREAPQSFAQQRLWFLAELAPGSALYNVSALVPLPGRLDVAALERALGELVRRHGSLRTTFGTRDGEPVQTVAAPGRVSVSIVDVRGVPAARRQAELGRLRREEVAKPFDLARGPLVRFTLARLADDRQVLIVGMHHIATDEWSMGVLGREIRALYEAFRTGEPSPLPDLAVQYADFAVWQREWLRGEVLEEQLGYWLRELDGAAYLELPADRPHPATPRYVSGRRPVVFEAGVLARLRELARREEATLFMTLLGAFQVLLGRYCDQEDVVVGSPIANRTRAELEGVIGFFVNTLALRTDLSGDPSFREVLARVRATCLGAYAHQDMPFEKLVEELAPQRDLTVQPLFAVLFVLAGAPDRPVRAGGPRTERRAGDGLDAGGLMYFDLTLSLTETTSTLRGELRFNADRFEPRTIERMARHLEALLAAIADDPDVPLSTVSMLLDDERDQLRLSGGADESTLPGRCVHELVEDRVDRAPEAVAVAFEGADVTYRELDRRANRLAHRLLALGVAPEAPVGVYLDRGIAGIVALLGILKAGGAYLPLDADLPPERLGWLLDDARPAVVLTREALRRGLPERAMPVLCLDGRDGDPSSEPDTRPEVDVRTRQLAYVVYTSGSTGRPKGVLVEHRSLCHTILAQLPGFGLSAEDRVLATTALSFDASLGEILRALVAGATLCLARRDALLPGPGLIELLREQRITTATMVTTVLAALPAHADLPELRTLTVGGEVLPAELAARWLHGRRLLNGYGPTEAAIGAILASDWDVRGTPPLGRPLPNVRALVLDASMRLLPLGVPGELHLGGPGLARGYLGRPDLTAERFLPDPFSGEPGARLYRTGDRVRWRSDGQLEFLGRVDEQVKIRGHRVEPAEVAAMLRQYADVADAAVVARRDGAGEARLVAYVVGAARNGGPAPDADDPFAEWERAIEAAAALHPADGENAADGVRGWADSTARRIAELGARDVLEIGSGSALILCRVAPRCRRYVAIGFCAGLLERAQEHVRRLDGAGCEFELLRRRPHELDELADRAFDCVVLNSVVQYFPDADYLVRILEAAVRLVRPGGRIFLGDIRNLRLLEASHASVQLASAALTLPAGRLLERISRHVTRERELVLDPRLFPALAGTWPRVTHAQALLMAGQAGSERRRFRYDIVLHVDGDPPEELADGWTAWAWDTPLEGLDALRAQLARGPAQYGVLGVPNAWTAAEAELLSRLKATQERQPLAELCAQLAAARPGVEPETLREVGRTLGYDVELSWLAGDPEGRYDALFQRAGAPTPVAFPGAEVASRLWAQYANDPARASQGRNVAGQLRDELVRRLPDHMIPKAFVMLDALPLTAHGKVDRRALPPPDDDQRPDLAARYVAPTTAAEQALVAIWSELLGLDRVGIHDNFFELGGDSILGIRVIARANQGGLSLTTQDVYRLQTVAEQAAHAESADVVAAEQGEVTGELPLTPIQQWFFASAGPEPHHFNWAAVVPVPRGTSAESLRQALGMLLEHHDALRLRFWRDDAGAWRQRIDPAGGDVPLTVVDLAGLPSGERRVEMQARTAELQTSLDLAHGPLLRVAWFGGGQLVLIAHHLVVDNISWPLLVGDLSELLRRASAGEPLRLSAKTSSFKDWGEHLVERARDGSLDDERRYWTDARRRDVGRLPVDNPDDRNTRLSERELTVALDEADTEALQRMVRSMQVRVDDVLLAALAVGLTRWTGGRRVLVNVERHGREDLGGRLNLSRTVGWFADIVPMLLEVEPEGAPDVTLETVRAQLAQAPHHGIGYGILRYLGSEPLRTELAGLPQAEVFFCYHGHRRSAGTAVHARPQILDLGPLRSRQGLRRHAVEINATIQDELLQMRWSFSVALHEPATLERWTRDYLADLQALINGVTAPVELAQA